MTTSALARPRDAVVRAYTPGGIVQHKISTQTEGPRFRW